MIQLGCYYIVNKNLMEELLMERDEYYKYKILVEMRQDDIRRQLEEDLEALKNSKAPY